MSKEILNAIILIILIAILGWLTWTLWDDLDWSHVRLIGAVFVAKVIIEFSKQVSNE